MAHQNSRVISVLRKFISNVDSIKSITRKDNEYYFIFRNKVFSILYGPSRDEDFGKYSLYVYPKCPANADLSDLADQSEMGILDEDEMITFHSGSYPDAEDQAAFEEFYFKLKWKSVNIDSLFDDILKD